MNSRVCTVAFNTEHWFRVLLGSFQEQFPGEKLLVVDNNTGLCEESLWLQNHPAVEYIPRDPNKTVTTHGSGIDRIVSYLQKICVDHMILVEPDCLISSTEWRNQLEDKMEQEALWMVGSWFWSYGCIHPCPSLWDIRKFTGTYDYQARQIDARHPAYRDLIDEDALRKGCSQTEWDQFFSYFWDTTQANWFQAALAGKTGIIPISELRGFKHFWKGSSCKSQEEIESEGADLLRFFHSV